MKINPDVLTILSNSTVEGSLLFLPPGQLDRKVYEAVSKVLDLLGGKWNRAKKAHSFDSDEVRDRLDMAIATGEVTDIKQELQYFPTPDAIAERLAEYADVEGRVCLEPSAGLGAIVRALNLARAAEVDMMEIHPPFVAELEQKYGTAPGTGAILCQDFLTWQPPAALRYTRIVMNPPFTKGQDMAHVRRAYDLLSEDGVLVAIMSPHFTFAKSSKAEAFSAWLESVGGEILEELEPGEFKQSGTMVRTVIIRIRRAA